MSRLQTRVGISGSVSTPGLAVPSPTADAKAAQVRDLLTAAGRLGSVVGQVSRQIDRANKAELDAATVLDKGQASEDFRLQFEVYQGQLPELFAEIPEGVEVPDFVAGLVGDNTEGRSDVYTDQYRKGITAPLVGALLDYRQGVQDQSFDEIMQTQSEAVVVAETSEDMLAIVDEVMELPLFKDRNLTRSQALSKLVLPSLLSAARNGDEVRFNAATEALGNRFPAEQLQALSVYEKQRQTAESERERAGVEEVTRELNAATDPNDAGTFADARASLDKAVADGAIDAVTEHTMRATINADENRSNSVAVKRLNEEFFESERDKLYLSGDADADWGGLIFTEDQEITLPNGTTRTVTAKEINRAVVNNRFAKIDEETEPGSPENFQKKFGVLSLNNETFKPWSSAMNAGPGQITADMTEAPQVLQASYELVKRMHAYNPALVQMHTNSDASNFYDASMFIQESLPTFGDNEALMAASRMGATTPFSTSISNNVSSKDFTEAVADVFPNARNRTAVSGKIEQMTRAYMTMGHGQIESRDRAIENFKRDHRVFNGHSVPVRGRTLPVNAERVISLIANNYASKHPEEGIVAGELTMVPASDTTWRITWGDDLSALDASFVVTDAQINAIGVGITGHAEDIERAKRVEARNKKSALARANLAKRVQIIGRNYPNHQLDTLVPPWELSLPDDAFQTKPVSKAAKTAGPKFVDEIIALGIKPREKRPVAPAAFRSVPHEKFGRFRP